MSTDGGVTKIFEGGPGDPDGLQPGEHALYVWKNPDERYRAIEAFVRAGLERDERVAVVPYPEMAEDMRDHLYGHEEFRREIDDHQVLVFKPGEFLPEASPVTRDALRQRYRELLARARKEGFRGLHLAVDLGAYLEAPNVAATDLERIERANGRSFPFKVRLLCLLDRDTASRLGVETFLRVVDSHTAGRVRYGE